MKIQSAKEFQEQLVFACDKDGEFFAFWDEDKATKMIQDDRKMIVRRCAQAARYIMNAHSFYAGKIELVESDIVNVINEIEEAK
jgi:hypothetical protein